MKNLFLTVILLFLFGCKQQHDINIINNPCHTIWLGWFDTDKRDKQASINFDATLWKENDYGNIYPYKDFVVKLYGGENKLHLEEGRYRILADETILDNNGNVLDTKTEYYDLKVDGVTSVFDICKNQTGWWLLNKGEIKFE